MPRCSPFSTSRKRRRWSFRALSGRSWRQDPETQGGLRPVLRDEVFHMTLHPSAARPCSPPAGGARASGRRDWAGCGKPTSGWPRPRRRRRDADPPGLQYRVLLYSRGSPAARRARKPRFVPPGPDGAQEPVLMKILGISAHYHDSAAALVIDGVPVCAVQEERLSRRKNDAAFPLGGDRVVPERARASTRRAGRRRLLREADAEVRAHSHLRAARRFPALLAQLPAGDEERARREAVDEGGSSPPTSVFRREDPLHRASPVACRGGVLHRADTRAAILTADGVGEWATLSVGRGERRPTADRADVLREIRFPHSLGMLYSTFTAYLGFPVNEGEYKVMGLAAYGGPVLRGPGAQASPPNPRTGRSQLDLEHFE